MPLNWNLALSALPVVRQAALRAPANDRDDVVQEVLLALAATRPPRHLRAWVAGTVRHMVSRSTMPTVVVHAHDRVVGGRPAPRCARCDRALRKRGEPLSDRKREARCGSGRLCDACRKNFVRRSCTTK